jgi:hypothetical protein
VAPTWFSIRVELIEGAGRTLCPRPGLVFWPRWRAGGRRRWWTVAFERDLDEHPLRVRFWLERDCPLRDPACRE